jgi:uncharacterized protein YbjT (DUF2867 family)
MIIVTGGSGKAGRACITELLAHNYEPTVSIWFGLQMC